MGQMTQRTVSKYWRK